MSEEYYEEVMTLHKIAIVETYEKQWAFQVLLPGPSGEAYVDYLPDLRFDTYDDAERYLHARAHSEEPPTETSRVRGRLI